MGKETLIMQMLAGVITEAEYKHGAAQLWYEEYANNLEVLLNKLKLTVDNERGQDI